MRTALVVGCLIVLPVWTSDPMKHILKDGEKWGKEGSKYALDQAKGFSVDDLNPPGGEAFDAKSAKSQVKNEDIPQTETLKFLQSKEVQRNERENRRFNEDEYFLKRSEAIANGTEPFSSEMVEESVEYSYETCKESEAPYPISLIRTLHVDVAYEPEQKKDVKVCLGHKKKTHFYWKEDAEDWVKKQKKKLSSDSTVIAHDAFVDKKGSGVTEKYVVRAVWTHVDDASTCDEFKNETKIVNSERLEEKNEKWVYSDESLLSMSNSPDCVLFEKVCLDASPKNINGKEVHKQCWKEKLGFLCQLQKSKQCIILREKNCEEVKRQCLQDGLHGCALWEVTYKCFGKKSLRSTVQPGQEIVGLGSTDWEIAYEPNQSFGDIYTKMSLFEEIKGQLEREDIPDATKIQLFKGKKMSCSKNVADNLMYDCCFSYGGLAKQLKLSQCTEKEISLGEMREKGLCHYVGKYEEKMLDLWKSSDVHVFCCFPSKLARVFQEEARNQTGMGWGKPKDPDCRGFFQNEIANVDFTKLNLTEVYDKQSQDLEKRLEQKLKSVTTQLQERIKVES